MATGIELIAKERAEQMNKHKRTIEKDRIENPNGELLQGAMALFNEQRNFPKKWDFGICCKMNDKSYKERLIIAGALIAAEIDRLQSLNPEEK
jgi:hypothetical protein